MSHILFKETMDTKTIYKTIQQSTTFYINVYIPEKFNSVGNCRLALTFFLYNEGFISHSIYVICILFRPCVLKEMPRFLFYNFTDDLSLDNPSVAMGLHSRIRKTWTVNSSSSLLSIHEARHTSTFFLKAALYKSFSLFLAQL